jgi:SAM-dependent methyltransferase
MDNSARQLATARALQEEFGIAFPLVHGNAEATPFEDASFDFAISEYGASIWCDPYAWIPEAARILRPGGRLVFLVDTPLAVMCFPEADGEPVGERLQRPYFGMHRVQWPGDDGVEFHLPHGELVALLRRSGFEIEALVEVRPSADATTRFPHATVEWARQWPYEELWKVRKRG